METWLPQPLLTKTLGCGINKESTCILLPILPARHLSTLRGHVGEVYQLSWSSDSRMFVSGSKDSTMKVWDTKEQYLVEDLPGHADEVSKLCR